MVIFCTTIIHKGIWAQLYKKIPEPHQALHLFGEPYDVYELNFIGIELGKYEPT